MAPARRPSCVSSICWMSRPPASYSSTAWTRGASEKAKLEMRRRMVIVFQKPVVFNSTVYDNVAYGLKIRGRGKSVDSG